MSSQVDGASIRDEGGEEGEHIEHIAVHKVDKNSILLFSSTYREDLRILLRSLSHLYHPLVYGRGKSL